MSSQKINYIFPDLRQCLFVLGQTEKRKQCWPDCTWPFFYYLFFLLKGEELPMTMCIRCDELLTVNTLIFTYFFRVH